MPETNNDYRVECTIHDLGSAVADAVNRALCDSGGIPTDDYIRDLLQETINDAVESALDDFKADLYIDSDMVDGLDGVIDATIDEAVSNRELQDYSEVNDLIEVALRDIESRIEAEESWSSKACDCTNNRINDLLTAVERLESRTIRGRWLAFRGLCRRMVERIKYPVNFWSM
tara:strand:+ start:1914 stop:2432 length:519 start_codon:yes stop_codon:yes gene_type:complete